ncbi:MAG: TldD/PmbA family protein [Deltaproteobacteria bacterium]|nr:TldD/PmbA family protein [Deltaproteobacteria bacterium]
MKDISARLQKIAQSAPHWTELRYQKRRSQSLQVQKGLIKQAKSNVVAGLGVRVFVDGAWGFSSTTDLGLKGIEKAVKDASRCATELSGFVKKSGIKKLPEVVLARGEFMLPGVVELGNMSLEQKLATVLQAEERIRNCSSKIQSATCTYQEFFEDKIVVTSDGAQALSCLARNELRLTAVAAQQGQLVEGHHSIGRTGPWECLFNPNAVEVMSEQTAKLAADLLKAPRVSGGLSTLILSPAMVGLLAHEAIGHTVEADFVLSGSVASGKLGKMVASPLITLCDSGKVDENPFGGGDILVDDEGVKAGTTVIIGNGILMSYLHNRESAALFEVEPTGNARAWLFRDEPLIRMRNTYIKPGNTSLEEMIQSTDDGYLVDGPLGGQADATGEFMFGAQKVQKIQKGRVTDLYRGATISGQAFNVLSTVDALSKEFRLDLGSGYCGKGQPAKVDAGGPYLRCKAIIGGIQK